MWAKRWAFIKKLLTAREFIGVLITAEASVGILTYQTIQTVLMFFEALITWFVYKSQASAEYVVLYRFLFYIFIYELAYFFTLYYIHNFIAKNEH